MVRAIAQWGEAELPEPEKAKNRALVDQLYQEVDDRGMLTKAASWTGNAIKEGALSIPAGAEAMVETGHGVKNLMGGSVEPSIRPDEALLEAARRDADIEVGKVKPLGEVEFWSGITRRGKTP